LRRFLEGHQLVVTSSKDGENSVFDRELGDSDIVISQPFWPAYLTAERIARAPRLKLAITAGIGSDHVDLNEAIQHGITVAEVTFSNSISVAEHAVMMILSLIRNYIPAHDLARQGGPATLTRLMLVTRFSAVVSSADKALLWFLHRDRSSVSLGPRTDQRST
jgi:formate dehydrogenase